MRSRPLLRMLAVLACAVAAAVTGPAHAQNAFQQGLDAYLKGEYQTALDYWRPAAESGNAVAAFNIGVLYAQGLGVEPDAAEAVRWYRRSAQAGYANAQFNLGAAYYQGQGTEVNLSQAVSWWERAAEQDHPEALYNLATLYRRGKGVPQDGDRARDLFSRAAALGDSRAQQALTDMGAQLRQAGDAPVTGPESTASAGGDPDTAEEPATPAGGVAAENPDHWTVQLFAGTEEQAARSFARESGLGDRLRIYRAERDGKTWFKGIHGSYADRAAAQAAQQELAREMPGTDPWVRSFRAIQAEAVADVTGASTAARREPDPGSGASAQRDPEPQSEPEPQADPEAPAANAPASGSADDGNQPAATAGTQAASGAADEGGQADSGTPEDSGRDALRLGQQAFNAQDYAAAFAAWRPLADQGVAEAQYGIGFMYESGWGVERDYEKAFVWYQKAAQQGHVKAQYNLGRLYLNGEGVSQNDHLGLYWVQTAADRGDERAQKYLEDMN